MTTVPQPADLTDTYTCVYDAWNRLVEIQDGEDTVVEYEYDGLGRRIRKTIDPDDTAVGYDYYNASWQVLEVRKENAEDPLKRYVWSLRYIDEPVVRFYDADTLPEAEISMVSPDSRHRSEPSVPRRRPRPGRVTPAWVGKVVTAWALNT